MWVIVANSLKSGEVIYITADSSWSNNYSEAMKFASSDEADKILQKVVLDDQVVDPYLVGVSGDVPAKYRERIRLLGPTIKYGEF